MASSYCVTYRKLTITTDLEQPDFFTIPKVIIATTVDGRAKYLDEPVSVGSTFESSTVEGTRIVYTILSCTLVERGAKRVRFVDFDATGRCDRVGPEAKDE